MAQGVRRARVTSAIVLLSLALAHALPGADAVPPGEIPRVLILFSNDRLLPANQRLDDGLRSALDPTGNQTAISFYAEFLDAIRLAGPEQEDVMAEYLLKRYHDIPPHAVIALGPQAFKFLLSRRATLFSGSPLIFGGVSTENASTVRDTPGVAGLPMDLTVAPAIEALLAMRPGTREIFLVHGSAEFDHDWRDKALAQSASFADRVTITDFPELPLPDLKKRLSELPADAAVVYLSYFQGPTGETYTPARVAREIAAASSVPVMGPYDTYIGTGVLGVSLSPFEDEGVTIGTITRRILSGESPSSIGVLPPSPTQLIIDSRQLARWHIAQNHIPPHAVLRFHEPTLWETHRTTVLIALLVLAAQSALILKLLAARRQARDSHASIKLAADSAGVGFWRREPDSDNILASPKWREIFGLPPDDPLSIADVLARIHPDDEPRVRQAIDEAARDGRRYEIEHRLVRPDGSVRWIASMGRADAENGGTRPGTRGVSVDITERKRMESEVAQQRSEMAHLSRVSTLGELSGSLAHELNQPLGSILTNAQAARRMMDRPAPSMNTLREILDDIISEDRRAGNVITRLKALLKRGEPVRQPVNLAECIDEVHTLLRSELTARGINVILDVSTALPEVMADRVQLQQVLLNLITNACDAMESTAEGRRVLTLRGSADDAHVHLEVRDTGSGINGDADTLFKAFHTTKQKGLGMGLAICRTIVDSHGGRLWAAPNPAGGAVFHLSLPTTTACPAP